MVSASGGRLAIRVRRFAATRTSAATTAHGRDPRAARRRGGRRSAAASAWSPARAFQSGQGRYDSGTSCSASSSSSPATTSRSTTIDRTCPRIISDDSPAAGSTRADSPATRSSTPRAADGQGVLVEHAGQVVGGVGERLDEVDVALGDRLVAGHGHGGAPGEHPQVAHAPVERHDEGGCRLGQWGVPAQQRRLAHDGHSLGRGGAQLGELALDRPGAVEGGVDASSRSRRRRAATTSRSVDDTARTVRAASARGRRTGEVGATAPMTSATSPPTTASSQREKATLWSATSATMNTDCTPAWMTSSWPDDTTIAIAMASTTTTAICHGPVPSTVTMRSPTSTPIATPTVTSTIRRSRCP